MAGVLESDAMTAKLLGLPAHASRNTETPCCKADHWDYQKPFL